MRLAALSSLQSGARRRIGGLGEDDYQAGRGNTTMTRRKPKATRSHADPERRLRRLVSMARGWTVSMGPHAVNLRAFRREVERILKELRPAYGGRQVSVNIVLSRQPAGFVACSGPDPMDGFLQAARARSPQKKLHWVRFRTCLPDRSAVDLPRALAYLLTGVVFALGGLQEPDTAGYSACVLVRDPKVVPKKGNGLLAAGAGRPTETFRVVSPRSS